MAVTELERRGWHLTGEYKARLNSDKPGSIDNAIKTTLDTDLKEIGAAWLDDNINHNQVDYVVGPGVLQLEELWDISSPKNDDVESQLAVGICRLLLSDGHVSCSAVMLEPIRGLSLSTPPGSKVLLSGKIEVNRKFLLLGNNNSSLLGGRVSSLVEPWEVKKNPQNVVKQLEPVANEGEDKRPPPFVPFGQKISEEMLLLTKTGNFQSLKKTKEKKATEEEIEFKKYREASLREAMRAKSARDSQRAFKSGHFMIDYGLLPWITSQGFSQEEAFIALQSSFGDPRRAIDNLFFERRKNHTDGNAIQPDTHHKPQTFSHGPPLNSPNNNNPHTFQQNSHIQNVRIYQGDKRVDNFKQQNQQINSSQGHNMELEPQVNEKQEGSVEEQNAGDAGKYGACSDTKQSSQNLRETEIHKTAILTNLQGGSNKENAKTENFQEHAGQSIPRNNSCNVNSDCQISLTNQCPGDYKSSTTYLGANNQRQNYQNLQNRDFSHRGGGFGTNMSQNHPFVNNYRSNHEQMSFRPPHGAPYINPPFDRQTPQFGAQRMGSAFQVQARFRGSPSVTRGFNNSGYTQIGYRDGGYAGRDHSYIQSRGYYNNYAYGPDNSGYTHETYNNRAFHRGSYSRGRPFNKHRPS